MKSKIANMNPNILGSILIIIANIFFAINIPVSRALTPSFIDPFGLSIIRIIFACITFFILGFFIKSSVKITVKDHIRLFLCGITGTTINQLAFLWGLSESSPVDSSIIITSTPIITMVFSALLIKEPISWKKAIGVGIGTVGAILFLFSSADPNAIGSGTLKGNLIVLFAAVAYSIYLVIVKPLMKKIPPVHIMKWIFFYGVLTALPLCYDKLEFIGEATTQTYLNFTYALLFGTVAAYLFSAFALIYIRPTTVSMYTYIQPLLASCIAIYIGQDLFTWSKPIYAAIIFYGVYLVITSGGKDDNK